MQQTLIADNIFRTKYNGGISTPGRWQSKTLILSTKIDQKSLETEFSIAILLLDWQQMAIENIVSNVFDPHSLIRSVFDCRLSGVIRAKIADHR